MSIHWDPKVARPGLQPEATPAQPATAGKRPSRETPAAMEKPKMLATPEAAQLHPTRQAPTGKPSLFEKEIDALRTALEEGSSQKLSAADQALARCASYAMRRSRGARRRALELCDEVGELVEERRELAGLLGSVLEAEGDLHETSAAGTLRACRRLIELLERDET